MNAPSPPDRRGTPEISVIIPTRNRPTALAQCLESLAAQEPSSGCFEVLVVDDGSSCVLDIDRFGSQIDLTVLRQNPSGPAAARNLGLSHARAPLIVFTDDDCRPCPLWLAEIMAATRQWPDSLVGGAVVNGLKHDWYAEVSQMGLDIVYEHFNHGPAGTSFFTSNNMAIPAGKLRELGGFDGTIRIAAAEDRDLCRRWKAKGWSIREAPAALVEHFHASGIIEFISMHFRYGRGACNLRKRHPSTAGGASLPEEGFHRQLPRRIWARLGLYPRRQHLPLLMSLFVWQAAGALGFYFEALASRIRTPRDNSADG